jgi:hypothetical protein
MRLWGFANCDGVASQGGWGVGNGAVCSCSALDSAVEGGQHNSGRRVRVRSAPPRLERMTRGEEKKIKTNRYTCVISGSGG